MAIFGSGLMQGESAGIPTGGLLGGGLSGNNALLNIGLGILANNQGNYGAFGPAVGRGALQGIQATQQAQQLGQMGQMRALQMQQAQAEAAKLKKLQEAKDAFKVRFPDLADAVDLDPSLAVKAAFPNIGRNSADPYFTPIPTEGGIGSFDARSGKFELITGPDGRPIVKTSDSPTIRGAVKSAEAGAGAAYKINTDIPGMVLTDEQVANRSYGGAPMPFSQLPMINAPMPVQGNTPIGNQPLPVQGGAPAVNQQLPSNNFNLPYPVTMGAPGTTATDRAEGITGESSIQLRDPRRPNAPRAGIVVPTPAQLAADKAKAEYLAETSAKAQVNLPNVIQESQNTIGLIDDLLKSPGLEQSVGMSRLLGVQKIPGTAAKDFDIRLEQLKGKQFLQAYESLKGAGAITDIEGTKAGNAISRMDASASEKEFKAAANEFKQIISQGLKRAQEKAGISSAQPTTKDSAMSAGGWSAKKVK